MHPPAVLYGFIVLGVGTGCGTALDVDRAVLDCYNGRTNATIMPGSMLESRDGCLIYALHSPDGPLPQGGGGVKARGWSGFLGDIRIVYPHAGVLHPAAFFWGG